MCAEGRRAEVAAPVEYVERRGLREGDAACHHGEEDQNVGRDQGVGDGVGTGCAGFRGDGGVVHVAHVSIVLALQLHRVVMQTVGVRRGVGGWIALLGRWWRLFRSRR